MLTSAGLEPIPDSNSEKAKRFMGGGDRALGSCGEGIGLQDRMSRPLSLASP